jgi:hypothetical protein
MDAQSYINDHQNGFFDERYSTISPFKSREFYRCYNHFVNVFYDIMNSWKDCPYSLFDEVMGWIFDNFNFIGGEYYARRINSPNVYDCHQLEEDVNTLIHQMEDDYDDFLKMCESSDERYDNIDDDYLA